jgi:hypothetical protein
MSRDVTIEAGNGGISAGVLIFEHIGVTAIDLWADEDGNGRPDRFVRRLKDWNDRENQLIAIGSATELAGKIVQWVWMPSQPLTTNDGWRVALHLKQGTRDLGQFPVELSGAYPAGQKYGLFETWARLVT